MFLNATGISSVDMARYVMNEGMATYYTETYTYGNSEWKYQLTAYKGVNFTYDEIGNPLVYDNGDSYCFTWQNGRQLVSAEVNGETITYTYDTNGLRTSKKSNNANPYNFYYVGDLLVCQSWDLDGRQLNFLYDESGSVYGFVYYDGWSYLTYYYVKNLQGDVVAILNGSNTVVAEYVYDAWGNIISVTDGSGNAVPYTSDHIANINPIRYRSYYYDTETMFYYLQSRYYDPYLGRFINEDGFITTGKEFIGYNLFAYCFNNPINNIDFSGNWTMGISLGANLTILAGVSISIGFFWDDNGNAEWQWSYAVPYVNNTTSIGLFDVGAALSFQATNADTVEDLHGPTTYIGGSAGSSGYVGVDLISFDSMNDPSVNLDGFQVSVGYGFGVDVHITETNTNSVGKSVGKNENQLYKILTFKEKRL